MTAKCSQLADRHRCIDIGRSWQKTYNEYSQRIPQVLDLACLRNLAANVVALNKLCKCRATCKSCLVHCISQHKTTWPGVKLEDAFRLKCNGLFVCTVTTCCNRLCILFKEEKEQKNTSGLIHHQETEQRYHLCRFFDRQTHFAVSSTKYRIFNNISVQSKIPGTESYVRKSNFSWIAMNGKSHYL